MPTSVLMGSSARLATRKKWLAETNTLAYCNKLSIVNYKLYEHTRTHTYIYKCVCLCKFSSICCKVIRTDTHTNICVCVCVSVCYFPLIYCKVMWFVNESHLHFSLIFASNSGVAFTTLFFLRNLQLGPISLSTSHWQAFPV